MGHGVWVHTGNIISASKFQIYLLVLYLNYKVRDDSTDENAQLNVWTLDGDRSLKYLMKFALNEQHFEDTTIVLVASLKHPWKIMESLEFWSARLQDHIDSLNLGMEQTQNLRDKCVDRIIDYTLLDGEYCM